MLVHTRVTGHVDVPLEVAWQVLADFRTMPAWHVGVVGVRDVAGTTEDVGSTATVILKGLDGPVDVHVEVTAVEPLRLATQIGRGLVSYTTTMHYTPAGRGYDFAWDQDTEWPEGLPGAFGDEAFVGRWMEQMLRQSADNARLFMEAMVPQPV